MTKLEILKMIESIDDKGKVLISLEMNSVRTRFIWLTKKEFLEAVEKYNEHLKADDYKVGDDGNIYVNYYWVSKSKKA